MFRKGRGCNTEPLTSQRSADLANLIEETLGNAEPAMRANIIPRYRTGPEQKPVWPAGIGYDWRTSCKFDPAADRPLVERLRRSLED